MRRLLLTLALLSLAFAPAPLPKSGRGRPNQTIQGTWIQVDDPKVTAIVTATGFEYHIEGRGLIEYALRLDATKSPPAYDLLMPDDGRSLNAVGIYKVEGQILTVCYAPGRDPRPTSFEGGHRRFKEVFRRLK
jgi:uncharacterized protein (TIGR03067 family)